MDCTPNPDQCGGTGGCQGGTAELAYARIIELGGLTSEALYPYVSGTGRDYTCKNPIPPPVAKVTNYTMLPENQYEPLLNAVATVGPIVCILLLSECCSNPSNRPSLLMLAHGEDTKAEFMMDATNRTPTLITL